MIDVEVVGADKFARLSRALRDAGQKDLRRELQRGVQRATKPMKRAVSDALLDQMPKAGGLNRRLARRKLSTRTMTGRDPGVRIVGKGLKELDAGTVRHPVFGDRSRWVAQDVPAGVVSRALERERPQARAEIQRAVDSVIDDVIRKAK